jgi:hypothetical protein
METAPRFCCSCGAEDQLNLVQVHCDPRCDCGRRLNLFNHKSCAYNILFDRVFKSIVLEACSNDLTNFLTKINNRQLVDYLQSQAFAIKPLAGVKPTVWQAMLKRFAAMQEHHVRAAGLYQSHMVDKINHTVEKN